MTPCRGEETLSHFLKLPSCSSFSVDFSALGGRQRADIVFTRAKVAVYIHGCYWHLCPLHATLPRANAVWWQSKLKANRERDRRARESLAANGCMCLTFWEHDEPEAVAGEIERAVRGGLPD